MSAASSQRPALPDRAGIQYHSAMLILAALVLIAAIVLDVRDGTQVLLPIVRLPLPEVCAWHRLTGLNCPGCGLTRSFIALADGDMRSAWSFNPAGMLFFAALLAQFPYRLAQLARLQAGRPAWRPAGAMIAVWVLVASLLVQWVWRL
jgi:hypothetical protein